MKAIIIQLTICILFGQQCYAQKSTWHVSLGPILETTKLINSERENFDKNEFNLPLIPSLGMLVEAGWQRKSLAARVSVGIKTNKSTFSHNASYKNNGNSYEFKSNSSESFLTIEPLLTVGYLHELKKGRDMFFGAGLGIAYNSKNKSGSGIELRSTADDTVSYQSYELSPEFQTTINPIIGLTIEYYHLFRSQKVGMAFGLQNKWGLTPLITPARQYVASFIYPGNIENYEARWAGHITNISFYLQIRFNFTKKDAS